MKAYSLCPLNKKNLSLLGKAATETLTCFSNSLLFTILSLRIDKLLFSHKQKKKKKKKKENRL